MGPVHQTPRACIEAWAAVLRRLAGTVAMDGGCRTNPRQGRWTASKGGFRNRPARPSQARGLSERRPPQLLWRALPRACCAVSQTALCNSLRDSQQPVYSAEAARSECRFSHGSGTFGGRRKPGACALQMSAALLGMSIGAPVRKRPARTRSWSFRAVTACGGSKRSPPLTGPLFPPRVSLLVFPSMCFVLCVSPLSATGRRPAFGCFLASCLGLARKGGSTLCAGPPFLDLPRKRGGQAQAGAGGPGAGRRQGIGPGRSDRQECE